MVNIATLLTECKSTIGITFFVFFLIFTFSDFTERVLVDASDMKQKHSAYNVKEIVSPLLTSAFVADMEKRYQQEQIKEEKKSNLPSLDEQLKQAGQLETVFSGNVKLSLKAVFNVAQTSAKYALISVVDMVSNGHEVIKVNDGEQVKGFYISIVGNKAVNLRRVNNQGNEITLVMYQQNQTNNK